MERISRRAWLRTAGVGLAAGSLALSGVAAFGAEGDDMVTIPAGPFVMGTSAEAAAALARKYGYHPSWLSGEVPARTVNLPAFAIDRHPVTNRQFAEFCRATGYVARPGWRRGGPPTELLEHPVTSVNRADARAYAQWVGKQLPTEAQWEKAARGPDGRMFPWGEEFDPEACQYNRDPLTSGTGTAPVTAHPRGASVYGVMDLVGNAAEWCEGGAVPSCGIIKGGCWQFEEIINLRPAARNMSGFDNNPMDFYGFRCVKELV